MSSSISSKQLIFQQNLQSFASSITGSEEEQIKANLKFVQERDPATALPQFFKDCKYITGRGCDKGNSCTFAHSSALSKALDIARKLQDNPQYKLVDCKMGDSCLFKEKCDFRHPGDIQFRTTKKKTQELHKRVMGKSTEQTISRVGFALLEDLSESGSVSNSPMSSPGLGSIARETIPQLDLVADLTDEEISAQLAQFPEPLQIPNPVQGDYEFDSDDLRTPMQLLGANLWDELARPDFDNGLPRCYLDEETEEEIETPQEQAAEATAEEADDLNDLTFGPDSPIASPSVKTGPFAAPSIVTPALMRKSLFDRQFEEAAGNPELFHQLVKEKMDKGMSSKTNLCRHEYTKGCWNGDSCLFAHDLVTAVASRYLRFGIRPPQFFDNAFKNEIQTPATELGSQRGVLNPAFPTSRSTNPFWRVRK